MEGGKSMIEAGLTMEDAINALISSRGRVYYVDSELEIRELSDTDTLIEISKELNGAKDIFVVVKE